MQLLTALCKDLSWHGSANPKRAELRCYKFFRDFDKLTQPYQIDYLVNILNVMQVDPTLMQKLNCYTNATRIESLMIAEILAEICEAKHCPAIVGALLQSAKAGENTLVTNFLSNILKKRSPELIGAVFAEYFAFYAQMKVPAGHNIFATILNEIDQAPKLRAIVQAIPANMDVASLKEILEYLVKGITNFSKCPIRSDVVDDILSQAANPLVQQLYRAHYDLKIDLYSNPWQSVGNSKALHTFAGLLMALAYQQKFAILPVPAGIDPTCLNADQTELTIPNGCGQLDAAKLDALLEQYPIHTVVLSFVPFNTFQPILTTLECVRKQARPIAIAIPEQKMVPWFAVDPTVTAQIYALADPASKVKILNHCFEPATHAPSVLGKILDLQDFPTCIQNIFKIYGLTTHTLQRLFDAICVTDLPNKLKLISAVFDCIGPAQDQFLSELLASQTLFSTTKTGLHCAKFFRDFDQTNNGDYLIQAFSQLGIRNIKLVGLLTEACEPKHCQAIVTALIETSKTGVDIVIADLLAAILSKRPELIPEAFPHYFAVYQQMPKIFERLVNTTHTVKDLENLLAAIPANLQDSLNAKIQKRLLDLNKTG